MVCVEELLFEPFAWKRPRMVFVNSMSDLFHQHVPFDFLHRVFDVMRAAHWHTFQFLTKRSGRLQEVGRHLSWPANVWMGVSVENADCCSRIDDLCATPAKIKFLSLEPLLGPLPNLNLKGIDWVIVGGESGPKARPMDPAWARTIRDQCQAAGVPFFLKQWGGVSKKRTGRILDGRTWDEMPRIGGQHFGVRSLGRDCCRETDLDIVRTNGHPKPNAPSRAADTMTAGGECRPGRTANEA